ncbi:MAG: hypothetical protein R2932_21075 [Caldilineaceae bacterium]
MPGALPWSQWQQIMARAYAHSTMVDAAAGLILDQLAALGLAENTVVIWTADRGGCLWPATVVALTRAPISPRKWCGAAGNSLSWPYCARASD